MRKTTFILGVLSVLTAIGVLWFRFVEGWSWLDASYMTVITLSTVGYGELHPLSDRSRLFVMFYLICGLGVFMFALIQLGELIVRAELRDWLRRRGMNSALKALKDHYVVCGFGRMGRTICRHLSERSLPFVVIDQEEDELSECERQGWLCIVGDATSDRTLQEAGLDRARGLAVVLDSDADNLFAVMSARLMAPGLPIIARATDEGSAHKMEKAGASRVVCLFTNGAATMAQQLINPNVEDFFEFVSGPGNTLDLAEIRVEPKSSRVHQTLAELKFQDQGMIIVAIRRGDGQILLPPPPNTRIEADDVLIALGRMSAISEFLAVDEANRSSAASRD